MSPLTAYCLPLTADCRLLTAHSYRLLTACLQLRTCHYTLAWPERESAAAYGLLLLTTAYDCLLLLNLLLLTTAYYCLLLLTTAYYCVLLLSLLLLTTAYYTRAWPERDRAAVTSSAERN